MQSEKKTEDYLNAQVKKRKGLSIKLLSMYMLGLPDRMVLLPKGYIVFIETKSEGEKPRRIQSAMHDKIRQLGFTVEVADTKERIDEILATYDSYAKSI